MNKDIPGRSTKVDNLQNMGSHILLDFHNIENIDLSDTSLIESIFSGALKRTDCHICDKRLKVFEDGQITLIYLLSESHLSFHCWPSEKSATVDFFNCGKNSQLNCKNIEEYLCEQFTWSTCSSNIQMSRGCEAKLLTNDYAHKTDLFKGLRMLKRVKSQFQDIRVYHSKYLGNTLVIDGQVQTCSALPDNYSQDITQYVLDKDISYEHVLLIGGGDLKVIEIAEEYFPELRLSKEMKERVNFIHMDGSDFLKTCQDVKFDAVIVDCSDVSSVDSVSSSLFTNDFYKKLLESLKPGASFSQMLTLDEVKPKFISMVENSGINCAIDFVITQTPEYGSCTPIGVVTLA